MVKFSHFYLRDPRMALKTGGARFQATLMYKQRAIARFSCNANDGCEPEVVMLTDLLDSYLEHVIGLLRYELPDAPIDAETPTAYAELICRILFELRDVPELCRRRDKWRSSYSAVCIYGDLAVYQSPERPINNKMCSVQCSSEREAWQFVAERSPNRIDGQLSAVWVIGLDKAGRLELTPDIYAGIIQNARIIREQWAAR